jgi:hypothetical protein
LAVALSFCRLLELTDEERQLDALRREYDLHQSHYQRNQNRLEAYLSRHWPEVNELLAQHKPLIPQHFKKIPA